MLIGLCLDRTAVPAVHDVIVRYCRHGPNDGLQYVFFSDIDQYL